MPSHRCHEEVGDILGLSEEAVKVANDMIDSPEKYPVLRELGVKHDDDRLFAMNVIRERLSELYGMDGVLAADLHYALDYIDRWLDPNEARRMLNTMGKEMLCPKDRRGFADPKRRVWHPSCRPGTIPITSYCVKCRGKDRLINSPFCGECHAHILEVPGVSSIPDSLLLSMLRKKMNERKVNPKIADFVKRNVTFLVNKIVEDRNKRGLESTTCWK